MRTCPVGQDVHELLSKLKIGVGSVQLMQAVPFQNGVVSGHGIVEFEGCARLGFDVKVLFKAEGAVPLGVSTGAGLVWHW